MGILCLQQIYKLEGKITYIIHANKDDLEEELNL